MGMISKIYGSPQYMRELYSEKKAQGEKDAKWSKERFNAKMKAKWAKQGKPNTK